MKQKISSMSMSMGMMSMGLAIVLAHMLLALLLLLPLATIQAMPPPDTEIPAPTSPASPTSPTSPAPAPRKPAAAPKTQTPSTPAPRSTSSTPSTPSTRSGSYRHAAMLQHEILMGHRAPAHLREIPTRYQANATSKRKQFLLDEVLTQFSQMASAARKDGVELKIISGYRTFAAQRSIWQRKWTGKTKTGGINIADWPAARKIKKIMEYSAMPGLSRHHWGTEVDVNALTNNYFRHTSKGKKVFAWLQKHAAMYGFCRPYDEDPTRTGYFEEKWHWSYKPISQPLTIWALQHLPQQPAKGFSGASQSMKMNSLYEDYIGGISGKCL